MDLYSLKYKYVLKRGATQYDITERVMTEPNIVSCIDYKENLSYVNEVSFVANNEDGYLYNGLTGLLDTNDKIELFITLYPDNGSIHGKKSFGGFLDLAKIKPDFVKKNITVNAYAYLGELDRVSALKVSRRYFKSGNLYLYKLLIVVKDAALNGVELEEGKHVIYTKLDETGVHKLAKLDDGEWVNFPVSTDVTIYDRKQLQAVKIRDYAGGFDVGEQDIIVKHKGDKYPYVYYYDAGLFEVMQSCLVESGMTDYFMQPYEIKTYDDRKIISKYENIEFDTYRGLISDGDRTVYIMLGNSVWKRDLITQEWEQIFVEPNNYEVFRLEKYGNTLIIYIGDIGINWTLRLYKLNLTNNTSSLLFDAYNNPIVESTNIRNAFMFSTKLNKFIIKVTDQGYGNPRICTMDLSGNITQILAPSNLVYDGFNFIWEGSNFLHYYYLTTPNNPRLYRITYDFNNSSFGAPQDMGFWYSWQSVTNLYVYGFYWPQHQQLLLRAQSAGNESYIYNLLDNTFIPDAIINPSGYQLFTPFIRDGILSVIAKKTSPAELRLAHFSHDVLELDEDFSDAGAIFSNYMLDFQKITTGKNYKGFDVITFVDETDKSLKRFSEWFIPYLKGELNPSDGNIRKIVDECVRTYLGYFYIDSNKRAYFFKRDEYQNAVVVTLDTTNKSRIMENLYTDKYDKIVTKNKESYAEYGITSIESKALNVDLNYVDSEVLKDLAKYFYDYYSVARKLYTITQTPSFYTSNILDVADMSAYGLSNGIIHEVSPKKSECKLKIIVTNE